MGSALSSGVTGLNAHQQMLEVAGNNLANLNTTAFKGSQIRFAELLSETISKATAPNGSIGGTNPQQLGSGVGVSNILRNMSQGGLNATGQALDMAISGEGYFVVNDGNQDIFTRIGSFAVDSNSTLVDPSTGNMVQRTGSAGESDGFQVSGDATIKIPFDAAMPAQASASFDITGNLRANGDSTAVTTNKMIAGMNYVLASDSSVYADSTTDLTLLNEFSNPADANFTGAAGGDEFVITGTLNDGSPVSTTFYPAAGATLGDLVNEINTAFTGSSTATLVNGEIILTDDASGYSQTDINISFTGTNGTPATFETPKYFQHVEAGGNDNAAIAIEVYDSMGGKHSLAGQFVKTDTANTWDLVLTSMSGDVESMSSDGRRIKGIEFDTADGSFKGINGVDTSELAVNWSFDPSVTQTIDINLGTPGKLDGLTQFKLEKASLGSTVNATGDDGYKAGSLSSVSASDGKIVGMFSNGVKKDIATVALAVFKNPSGLEAMGSGYFTSSANSGQAVITESRSSGAGTVVGQQLEKSNVDVAAEFVNMIQAQNGYQANARTIRVANEVLQELTNLIR